MTNSWNDIKNADVVIIMGGNAAEAHPCGFKWVTEAKANNGAKLIVVDPRFTRSASVSDLYAPLRPGTDLAFLSGVMRYLLATGKRSMTSLYALGWTQHTTGSQNIRAMAMIQLLLGNMGVPGGGVNALRGHSNVQGITDLALLSTSTPGYLVLPTEKEATYADYIKSRAFKPIRPGQTSFWQNYGKFFVSQQKSLLGAAATKDNDWAYDYLPKFDTSYDVLKMVDMMPPGQMNGLFCQGLNILMAAPNKAKVATGLAKLKWLVIIDPLETETAHFCQNHRQDNHHD